ncbi:hypothetical protein [Flagellimonas sp.]|uniref:hypothetical protein n=1 Tax=Flagellimonas sp. TaxID=2058762 RepID=UPI003B52E869
MKPIIAPLIAIHLFTFASCSKSDNTPTDPNPTPTNLVAATLSFPTNNLVCTNYQLEFKWSLATENSGDDVQNVIEVSKDESFATTLFQEVVSGTTKSFTVEKNSTYYWRITSKRLGSQNTVSSEVWQFETEPEPPTNNVPYAAVLVGPSDGETITGNTVTLSWSGIDIDNDPLTYDVFFGTTNPPTSLVSGITETTRNVDLPGAGTYYWRIVVKDDKQSAAIGNIWSFMVN